MKKIFLLTILLCSIICINAQDLKTDNDNSFAKSHELKINGIYLVVGAFEVTYEYLLNEESAVGMSVFIPYDKEIKDEIQYYVSPYYRFYFGEKYAAGFFLEGFGMLNSAERDFDFFVEENDREYTTDFALGIGLGGKWITKSGFIGEINFGVGRNLFKSEETSIDFTSKFGISLGYRF